MMPSAVTRFYNFGPFQLDLKNYELLKDGEQVALTQKCFNILIFLIENRGTVISKEELSSRFWDETYVEDTNVIQHIYRIRRALKDEKNDEGYIKTISKIGYKFVADVNVIDSVPITEGHAVHHFGSNGTSNGKNGYLKTSNGRTPDSLTNLVSGDVSATSSGSGRNWIRRPSYLFAVLGLFSVLGFGSFIFFQSGAPASQFPNIDSLAILPFEQIGDDADEKLGLGVADTLIAKLSNQRKIAILPTTTIIKYYENGRISPSEIGKKLNVDAVLIGTIQKDGDRVRINMQLLDVKENLPIWSEKFDSPFSNVFLLQDQISERIAQKFSLDLPNSGEKMFTVSDTKDIEAYKAFSQGLFHWDKREPEDLRKALGFFKKAVELDPKFAKAYAYLADTYALTNDDYYKAVREPHPVAKAREMADKALSLDPQSAEALTTLGLLKTDERDFRGARLLLDKAVSLKPNNTTANMRLAWISALEGDLEQSVEKMRLAYKANPQSLTVIQNFTYYLYLTRKSDEALALAKSVMENLPPSDELSIFLTEIYEQKGEYAKAIEEITSVVKKSPQNSSAKFALSRLYAKAGKENESRTILDQMPKKLGDQAANYENARIEVFLGNEQTAIQLLKKIPAGEMYLLTLKHDYNFDKIRMTPEFKQVISSIERHLG